jgi:hypothetical protein
MTTRSYSAAINEAVERVRVERVAAGQSENITDPTVYRILDGIMAGRAASSDGDRAARRRRATQRSQGRVPYCDDD